MKNKKRIMHLFRLTKKEGHGIKVIGRHKGGGMKVLLSIKPVYVAKIFSGEKTVEYRKKVWKHRCDKRVIVYASSPVCKVVGEFEVDCIVGRGKDYLWRRTSNLGGINKATYQKYFADHEVGYGIYIKSYQKYNTPRPLSDYGISRPPQNFMYLKEGA